MRINSTGQHPGFQGSKPIPHRPSQKDVEQDFDLIVIGGGINGSGIARDAAERGMSVLLVEKSDFGAGTSAYSSRLIHGGLRYLENFELGLVRESLRERKFLLENAPHIVQPLSFGVPVYKESKRPLWMIIAGTFIYSLLSLDSKLYRFRPFGKKSFAERYPGLKNDSLKGGVIYYDAQAVMPERICVENAIAARDANAVVFNHANVNKILTDEIANENRQASGVEIEDLLTGQTYIAKGKMIVNASGPWVDKVIEGLDAKVENISQKIGGTKGTHLLVKRPKGAAKRALYVEAQADGRPYFIIPFLEDYYLIGTTDIHYKENLDTVQASQEEIDYLINETNRVMPEMDLKQEDILYAYAGVRPLPYRGNKKAGKITRKHILHDHQSEGIHNLVSIIGGKLTTYRNLAEEAVDAVRNKMKLSYAKCTTRTTPLPGGKGVGKLSVYKTLNTADSANKYKVKPEIVSHLIDVYGSKYTDILDLTQSSPDLKNRLSKVSHDIEAQVIYEVRERFATSSLDVLKRRTGTALRQYAGLDAVKRTAEIIGQELGWSNEQIQADIDAYTEHVKTLNQPLNLSGLPTETPIV